MFLRQSPRHCGYCEGSRSVRPAANRRRRRPAHVAVLYNKPSISGFHLTLKPRASMRLEIADVHLDMNITRTTREISHEEACFRPEKFNRHLGRNCEVPPPASLQSRMVGWRQTCQLGNHHSPRKEFSSQRSGLQRRAHPNSYRDRQTRPCRTSTGLNKLDLRVLYREELTSQRRSVVKRPYHQKEQPTTSSRGLSSGPVVTNCVLQDATDSEWSSVTSSQVPFCRG